MVTALHTTDGATTLFEVMDRTPGEPVTSALLSREQVIERIMTLNPTASVQFLEDFDERQLQNYLDHLTNAQIPRGRMARWVRPGDTPGIVVSEPRD